MGVDIPPDQGVEVLKPFRMMPEGECLTHGRADACQKCGTWWCWSITLQSYWRPDTDGIDTWAGPDAPGHWPQCGWFTETPEPTLLGDDELGDGQ